MMDKITLVRHEDKKECPLKRRWQTCLLNIVILHDDVTLLLRRLHVGIVQQECKAVFAPGRSPAVFAAAEQQQRSEAMLSTGHAAHWCKDGFALLSVLEQPPR